MIPKILLPILFSVSLLTGFTQNRTGAFAITGQANKNLNWTDLRSINLGTGEAEKVYFESGKTKFSLRDDITKETVDKITIKGDPAKLTIGNNHFTSGTIEIQNITPTSLMSAALAYDKKHDKLFFASMHTGSLVWLDLSSGDQTPSFYTIEKKLVNSDDFNNEAFNITRMAIGSDGNGYALSNDGNHLVKFTTGKKTIITDLGGLIDDANNKGISVHNQCSSWGGDVVADAFGKLYLFTAFHNIFEIDIQTRVATYKGSVSNLPTSYLLNGAAVDDDGDVIVSSGSTFEGFFKVNMSTYTAQKLNTKGQVFNASDLASSNLLKQNMAKMGAPTLSPIETLGNQYISIFPNPVTHGQVKILFENNFTGEYKIDITDLQGRLIENKTVFIKYPGQTENFKFKNKLIRGLYFIKISDSGNQKLFADKFVVD